MLLVPMTDSEFERFSKRSVADYAAEKVRSGEWSESESLAQAEASFRSLLPDGRRTEHHWFLVLRIGAQQTAVGSLWYASQIRANQPVAYVYDIYIDPEHRREGHAVAALNALDLVAQGQGLGGVALHVFGHNSAARALYERMGYSTTNIHMFKPVSRAES